MAPAASDCAQPALASDGDAWLLLDDGQTLQVHAALLRLQSPVLRDAVDLANENGPGVRQIPLPSTPVAEAKALVELLYSKRPESYVTALPLEHLCQLVEICHRFGLDDSLAIVEEAMARRTGSSLCLRQAQHQIVQDLKPDSVIELYQYARSKGLKHFQLGCAAYIAANARQVAEAAPEDALGPVLMEVAEQSSYMAARLQHALMRVQGAAMSFADLMYETHSDENSHICRSGQGSLRRAMAELREVLRGMD